MIAYLVRHGITDWNLQGRGQGLEDIELNEGGIKQAAYCGQALEHVPVDCIATSPLKRAVKTAEAIYKYHKDSDFVIMKNFIERDLGKYSGLTSEERKACMDKGIPSNAEPRPDVAKRAFDGLEELEKQYPDGHVVVVTHGGVITAMLEALNYAEIYTVFIENVYVTEIEVSGGNCKVLRCNVAPENV